MMTTAEVTHDVKAFHLAWCHVDGHHAFAGRVARVLEAGSVVKVGAVTKRGSALAFDIRGNSDGFLWSVSVVIPPAAPQGDIWAVWIMTLEDAGLRVKRDSVYDAKLSRASARELEGFHKRARN
jgi:hypothetical protein